MNYADKSIIIDGFTDLIKYYAGKSPAEDMSSDLMLFLLELISAGRAISRRYVAVAVRNEYIRLSKAEAARRSAEVPYNEEMRGQEYNAENIIDMKNALRGLPEERRRRGNARQRHSRRHRPRGSSRYHYSYRRRQMYGIPYV